MKLILVLIFIVQCFISVTLCQDLSNSYYYNEDQTIEIFGGGSTLSENPAPNVTWVTSDQTSTLLTDCVENVPIGEHYFQGPPICTLTKSQTLTPNAIANFIFKVPIGDKPITGKNVSLTFAVQNITSVTNNATHITINAVALLPSSGLASIENGMTLSCKFIKDDNVTIVTEQLSNCVVVTKFKIWVCPTVNPTLLKNTYTVTYTYQYPTELKSSTFIKSPTPPVVSSSSSFSSDDDFSSSSKIVFSFILLITSLLISFCTLYLN